MNVEYLPSFVANWCSHVQDEIIHLLIRNILDFKKNKIKCQYNLKAKILITKTELNEGLRSLVSNPSVLPIICTLFARHGIDTLKKNGSTTVCESCRIDAAKMAISSIEYP